MNTGTAGLSVAAPGLEIPLRGRVRAYLTSDSNRTVLTVLGLIWPLHGALQFPSFMVVLKRANHIVPMRAQRSFPLLRGEE